MELKEAVEYVREMQAGRDREKMELSDDTSLDVLKELDDLRNEGIITEEEFKRKKEEILRNISDCGFLNHFPVLIGASMYDLVS